MIATVRVLLCIAVLLSGCATSSRRYVRIQEEEESRRQAIESVVPEELRNPLPYRLDRYEAVGFSDEMLIEETARNRAMTDMLQKLSVSTRADVLGETKNYLSSHPVVRQIGRIDTSLSLTERFYQSVTDVITDEVLKDVVISYFWRDDHGLIGRKGMMYCYGFAARKEEEFADREALGLAAEEVEQLKDLFSRRTLSAQTRQKMDALIEQRKEEVGERRWSSDVR